MRRTSVLRIAYVEFGFAYEDRKGGLLPVSMRHRLWPENQRVEMSMEHYNGERHAHATVGLDFYEETILALKDGHPQEPKSELQTGS